MCWQCVNDHFYYGEVVPDWAVIYIPETKGWGLLTCNDPTFWWSSEPIMDNTFYLSDEEINAGNYVDNDEEFYSGLEEFESRLACDPLTGYHLSEACMKAGYNREEHGYRICWWLFHKIAELVSVTIPDDRFRVNGSHKGTDKFIEEQNAV